MAGDRLKARASRMGLQPEALAAFDAAGLKWCPGCATALPQSEFGLRTDGKRQRLQPRCRPCRAAAQQAVRETGRSVAPAPAPPAKQAEPGEPRRPDCVACDRPRSEHTAWRAGQCDRAIAAHGADAWQYLDNRGRYRPETKETEK